MGIQMKIFNENKEEKKLSVVFSVNVKLPKLVISKFEGIDFGWFHFWNQFESEVDLQDISPVTTFSYVKEFLFFQARKLIDGLSLTSEGYFRAKSVLLAKFGKSAGVANAHVKCIKSLPVVSGTHPNRIHDFFAKLYVCVQALDTMTKLKEINGYVKITLDKLSGNRGDLVSFGDYRKLKLSRLKLCSHCTGSKHRASVCKTTKTCQQKGTQLSGQRLAFGNKRFPVRVRLLAMCRGELSAVIAWLMSKCM